MKAVAESEPGERRSASLVVGAVVLAGCSSGPTLCGRVDRLHGQHVQTTQALISAFEKQTGITVNLRSDDEDVLADQIVTEGSRSPADVFFTENSPPLQYLASKGLLAPVAPSTLANTPSPVQLARRQVGGGHGPGQRHGLQHVAAEPEPAPDIGHGAGRPEMEGQDRHRRRRDRLPTDRHLHRPHPRRGGRAAVARGGQGERREPQLPRQRDRSSRGQPRAGGAGRHQPVLLVP